MKKIVYFLLVLSFIGITAISCRPDTSSDDPIGTGSGKANVSSSDMGRSEDTSAATSSSPQPDN